MTTSADHLPVHALFNSSTQTFLQALATQTELFSSQALLFSPECELKRKLHACLFFCAPTMREREQWLVDARRLLLLGKNNPSFHFEVQVRMVGFPALLMTFLSHACATTPQHPCLAADSDNQQGAVIRPIQH